MSVWHTGPWAHAFKRVSEGWVFRSPVCWWPLGLGPSRHYLVNETQKAEILRVLNRRDWRFPGLILCAVFPAMVLAGVVFWYGPLPGGFDLVFISLLLLGVWTQVLLNIFYSLALKSTLAGAPRTSERIAIAAMAPAGIWVFGGVIFSLVFGVTAYRGELIEMSMSAVGALFFLALAILAKRSKP